MDDDSALVASVLARVPGAFELLVARHRKLVWHLVYRVVRHPEDTRDLCQDVFLRVYQRLDQFRFECGLASWIGRIAFNVASRHLDRQRLRLADAEQATDDGAAIERIGDGFDLEGAFANAELASLVREALAALPPTQRRVMTHFHLDEIGIAEISRMTELPEGTIKNCLFRARQRVRQRIEAPGKDRSLS